MHHSFLFFIFASRIQIENKMIFVHDKGRMANNMLQYGHVYAWGREHGRTTMSMRFAYKYPWFHICHTPHHNFPPMSLPNMLPSGG